MTETDSISIGSRLARIKDRRLLSGGGRYVDDFLPTSTPRAYFLRSPHAHARVCAIDTRAACSARGMLAIFLAEDIARDKIGDIPCVAVPPPPKSLYQARDAAELIRVDYEALPAVATLAQVIEPDASVVWPRAAGNVGFRIERGTSTEVD